jgi:glycosyltransferase involved in cell wall biosynthesis
VLWYLHVRGVLRLHTQRRIFDDIQAPNVVEARAPVPTRWFEPLARHGVPKVEWSTRSDLLLAPNFIPPPTRRRVVLTVHDLAFAVLPRTVSASTRRWLSRLGPAIEGAERVIAVSEQTRIDLLDRFRVPSDRVVVVPLGIDPAVYRPVPPSEVDAVLRRFGVDRPFLLTLGAIEPRKNLPSLLRAYAMLPADIRPALVVAGPLSGSDPQGLDAFRTTLGGLPARVRDGVSAIGYVSEAEKVALLTGCVALAYPSVYEGFGLPILEAMACAAPVLTSNVSAMPDTAGGAACLVDPNDEASIAAGLERILTDDDLRSDLRGSGLRRAGSFTWEDTARGTVQILHDAVGSDTS